MKKNDSKKQGYSKQEEARANRVIRNLCVGLALLAVLMMVVYSIA